MQVERHDLDEAIHRVLTETRPELAERVAGGRREGLPGTRIQDLHLATSDAMRHEYRALARREDSPVPAVVA